VVQAVLVEREVQAALAVPVVLEVQAALVVLEEPVVLAVTLELAVAAVILEKVAGVRRSPYDLFESCRRSAQALRFVFLFTLCGTSNIK
jgi:hypothetical protein